MRSVPASKQHSEELIFLKPPKIIHLPCIIRWHREALPDSHLRADPRKSMVILLPKTVTKSRKPLSLGSYSGRLSEGLTECKGGSLQGRQGFEDVATLFTGAGDDAA